MRGAFVARFGPPDTAGALDHVGDRHRWHTGEPVEGAHGRLTVALLAGSSDGPTFHVTDGTAMLCHGDQAATLAELEASGGRFSVIESDGRSLNAARDPLGLCPLFYRVHAGAVWLSTEVDPLLALGDAAPDLAALTAQIALVPMIDRTGWSGVFRLPSGCRLRVSENLETTVERYWHPSSLLGGYRGTEAEAADELSARLFQGVDEAVRGRNAGILLSGGLDSAAVVVTAQPLGPPVPLVHVVFPGLRDTDEERYARSVSEAVHTDLDVVAAELHPWSPEDDLRAAPIPYLTSPSPQVVMDTALGRLAELHVDAALDGNDGDGVLGYRGREWGELVRRGRVRRIAQLARRYGVGEVGHALVDDLVPPAARLRRLRGRPPLPLTYLQQIEPYFGDRVRREMRQEDHERWREPFGEWRWRQIRQVMPVTTVSMEEHELRAARFGLDARHPFADRALVEFLISLPVELKSDPFLSKPLLRRALADRMPGVVLERIVKPLYYEILERRVDLSRCIEWIHESKIELPHIEYGRLYVDAERGRVPLFLLVLLARVHVFAAAGRAGA